jgi:UDP-2-acetamido-2,6-beta-L-arabino-hexul-4-ose reductase
MKVVVTGASGFIGRRVVTAAAQQGHSVVSITRETPRETLVEELRAADAVMHLAGANRPKDPADFQRINADLTASVCDAIDASRRPIVIFSSSTQSGNDTEYGRTKREAEDCLGRLASKGARVVIFRLPNVFGPGARPNYNSAVATFAHNAANGKPLEVHDASRELSLVYVHDVAAAIVGALSRPPASGVDLRSVEPVYCATVGRLAALFQGFAASRSNQRVPDVAGELPKRLYATYLSHLPASGFAYDLPARTDDRGSLAEFLKSDSAGQIFVSRTHPGITRGNHFHHTKTEKFLVLEGDAIVRFRRVDGTGQILEYPVSGSQFRVVDIPPDYTHSIENTGARELVVLFWASEIFDPAAPDTMALNVR